VGFDWQSEQLSTGQVSLESNVSKQGDRGTRGEDCENAEVDPAGDETCAAETSSTSDEGKHPQ
jgi:hypothetical protein